MSRISKTFKRTEKLKNNAVTFTFWHRFKKSSKKTGSEKQILEKLKHKKSSRFTHWQTPSETNWLIWSLINLTLAILKNRYIRQKRKAICSHSSIWAHSSLVTINKQIT